MTGSGPRDFPTASLGEAVLWRQLAVFASGSKRSAVYSRWAAGRLSETNLKFRFRSETKPETNFKSRFRSETKNVEKHFVFGLFQIRNGILSSFQAACRQPAGRLLPDACCRTLALRVDCGSREEVDCGGESTAQGRPPRSPD